MGIQITPELLKEQKNLANKEVLEKAFESFSAEMLDAAKKGMLELHIPAPNFKGILYYDDRQKAFVGYLREKGFACVKKSVIIGGVRQDPSWYVVF